MRQRPAIQVEQDRETFQASPPISLERCAAALAEAREVLRRHGYDHDISTKDLLAYAEADTLYPSAISWDEILENRLIVVHEVVEVAELKRMGLEITRDVIVRNLEQVYEAHLRAAEIEMSIAQTTGSSVHLRSRSKAVQDWIGDPLVPAGLRSRYEALHARVRHAIAHLSGEANCPV